MILTGTLSLSPRLCRLTIIIHLQFEYNSFGCFYAVHMRENFFTFFGGINKRSDWKEALYRVWSLAWSRLDTILYR